MAVIIIRLMPRKGDSVHHGQQSLTGEERLLSIHESHHNLVRSTGKESKKIKETRFRVVAAPRSFAFKLPKVALLY